MKMLNALAVFPLSLFLSTARSNDHQWLNSVSQQTRPCTDRNDYGERCLTERQFSETVEQVMMVMKPYFEKHGWALVSATEWANPKENATYGFPSKNTVSLRIFGGVARAKEMSIDALTIVACHEVGHVYGFISKSGLPQNGFEGEADYIATSFCSQKVWAEFKETKPSPIRLPRAVQAACRRYSRDWEICERINRAGFSTARMIARARQQPDTLSFLKPDPTIVPKTLPDRASAHYSTWKHLRL
jgi:hypothetical protein